MRARHGHRALLLCLFELLSHGPGRGWARNLRVTPARCQSPVGRYGYQRMALTLPNLTRAGLLKKQEARNHWTPLKKGLKLLVDASEHELGEEPSDLSYVYAGCARHAQPSQPLWS